MFLLVDQGLRGGGKRGIMGAQLFANEERMVRENDLVAIFNSIHRVMKAEKILKQAGIEILLIPVPRQLASDCGLAIRYAPEVQAGVEEILRREGLEPAETYRREGKEYQRLGAG
jgi:hypothetical protein